MVLFRFKERNIVEIHNKNNSHGVNELLKDMNKAGNVLNKAKEELEKELERGIVTSENYNQLIDNKELK